MLLARAQRDIAAMMVHTSKAAPPGTWRTCKRPGRLRGGWARTVSKRPQQAHGKRLATEQEPRGGSRTGTPRGYGGQAGGLPRASRICGPGGSGVTMTYLQGLGGGWARGTVSKRGGWARTALKRGRGAPTGGQWAPTCTHWPASPPCPYRGPPSSSAGQGKPKKNGDLRGTYIGVDSRSLYPSALPGHHGPRLGWIT